MVLAYAITVHKSQGSEYPALVLPLTTNHYMMLQRNLLYTAMTRGKQLVILIGMEKAIWIALDKVTKSNGGLCYYEKSHQAGLFKHMSSFAKGSSQKIAKNNVLNQFKKKFPNLYPGDALIHHCLTIHGSKRNKTSFSRRGLTLQFRDKNSAIDKILKRNYEKQLKFQI